MWWPVIISLVFGLVSSGQVSVCIMNCGQCKVMFGPYFKGSTCAKTCMATFGQSFPDCNNPFTVDPYLIKKLYSIQN